ncbi:interferon alpha-inducible protein 27, mitochondrial-like [Alligator mississippiensis]|uniref:interferon alpha-inducible protein 27, mitochondrial-like n=1 Tax=Alligator mississippiensis TaxID=8496 RepID=UPI00071216C3|nr:interferon alpha-inducible protein 27, mitochondrial-like [Alligator mississippiensis]
MLCAGGSFWSRQTCSLLASACDSNRKEAGVETTRPAAALFCALGFHFPAQRQEIVGHHHSLQSVAGLQTSPEMVRATGSEVKPSNNKPVSYMARFVAPAVGAAVGLGIAFVGVPTALGAAGFTTAGVAAGSLAAKMMSAAAVANGGGLAAGGVVPCLQSLGALGLSGAAKGAVMATGTAIGALIRKR